MTIEEEELRATDDQVVLLTGGTRAGQWCNAHSLVHELAVGYKGL